MRRHSCLSIGMNVSQKLAASIFTVNKKAKIMLRMSRILLIWISKHSLLDKPCWQLIKLLCFSARYSCFPLIINLAQNLIWSFQFKFLLVWWTFKTNMKTKFFIYGNWCWCVTSRNTNTAYRFYKLSQRAGEATPTYVRVSAYPFYQLVSLVGLELSHSGTKFDVL